MKYIQYITIVSVLCVFITTNSQKAEAGIIDNFMRIYQGNGYGYNNNYSDYSSNSYSGYGQNSYQDNSWWGSNGLYNQNEWYGRYLSNIRSRVGGGGIFEQGNNWNSNDSYSNRNCGWSCMFGGNQNNYYDDYSSLYGGNSYSGGYGNQEGWNCGIQCQFGYQGQNSYGNNNSYGSNSSYGNNYGSSYGNNAYYDNYSNNSSYSNQGYGNNGSSYDYTYGDNSYNSRGTSYGPRTTGIEEIPRGRR